MAEEKHARTIDRYVECDLVDEALKQAIAQPKRNRRRTNQGKPFFLGKTSQHPSAITFAEHVLVGACAMKGDHQWKGPIAIGHELPGWQIDAKRAIDSPKIAGNGVRLGAQFRSGDLAFKRRQRRVDIAKQR
ncbi:MAG: hypothetical protein DWI09_04620 [Planctomycetota bacterium]|nr:MAG: hypothetical protein DWI09_04620 [Planctomycetota bacterium]